MLNEYNHIARQMLFLHGHLTRPTDWAENQAPERSESGRPVAKKGPIARTRGARLAAACIACGIVTPQRFVTGQIR